jgi:hypothetical protein
MIEEKNNVQINDQNGNSSKPLLQAVSLLPQLEKWIKDCEIQADIFSQANMPTSQISSQAMAQAYWNVKSLIEVNCL